MKTYVPNEYSELQIGERIGSGTRRSVILRHKMTEHAFLFPTGESYASWIAICYAPSVLHPYVVWDVIARPEGWCAERGDYFRTLEQAVNCYEERKAL